ncbi:pilus assembly protein [Eionea flava]
MLKDIKHPPISLLAKACLTASISFGAMLANAAPGELSDKPLTLVTSTKPNILLLLDDSGSMNFEAVVTDEAQQIHGVDSDNDLAPITRVSAQNDQELRALCVGYNALAYDPNESYSKWKDYLGNVFPDNQAVDMTAVVDNPYNGPNSVSTSDLTDHIYIRWDDDDSDGVYDFNTITNTGECGPSITQYDSAAAESIALPNSGVINTSELQGTFSDSNLNGGDRYRADDSGTLVIDVSSGGDHTSDDTITFTVVEFNVDSGSDTDSLTVYGGDAAAPITNAITVTSQFDFFGNPTPVSGASYTLPNNSSQPTVSSSLILNDDSSGNRKNEIHQFTVKGSKASLVFNGGNNIFTRSGFIISWRHSDSNVGPPGDGLLTKEDCDESNPELHCVIVENLPLTAADAPVDDPYNTQENYANWYTYYRDRISVAKGALSDVVYDSEYRVGLATLNDNGYGGAIIKDMENDPTGDISTDKSTLLEKIYATRLVRTKPNSSEGTPLIRGLSNAGRYFTEGADPESSFFGSTGTEPFVEIAATHQEDDDNISSNDTTVPNSPIFSNAYGGECQQNFTLAFTDGAWDDTVADYLNTGHDINGGASGFVGDQDSVGPYAGVAYADVQVNGTGFEDSLADVAMYYFSEDLASSVRNSLSVKLNNDEIISHQHMVTFGVGFGVSGNATDDPTDFSVSHNRWPNPITSTADKIDDLRHAAFNGRGSYVSASNAENLRTELDNIITEIGVRLNNTATGSSFSSFQLTDGEFRFSSSYETANWSGDLEGFSYISASNTFSDIATWSAQEEMSTRVDRETTRNIITSNGDRGIPFRFSFMENGVTTDYRSAGNSTSLSSSQVADLLTYAPHTTATDIPTTTDVSEIARNQAYGEVLVNYLRGDGSYDGLSLDGTSVLNGTKVSNGTGGSISFSSATDSSSLYVFRNRDERYLGSMVHSQPEFVGAPNNTYPDDIETESYSTFANNEVHKARESMIYIGSNGGMLHGFYATGANAGDEVFAYVPSILSDASLGGRGLNDLALETYDGNAYVDGSPNVSDVFVDREYSGDSDFSDPQWRSYLVGGLRSGGRGLYVLDVTNPDSDSNQISAPKLSDAENVADRIVVSEFVHEKLGYVYSRPIIGKMNNGRWAAILGNGYNSSDSGAGTASLFIVYLDAPTEKFTDPDTNITTFQTTDSDGDGILNDGYGDYTIITASASTWIACANDGETCRLPENAQVRYGSDGVYTTPQSFLEGDVACDVATMGDPGAGAATPVCEYSDSNGLSQPEATDLDGNGTLDRIYAGDLHGNMWIFDVSNTSDGAESAAAWGLHSADNTPFFTACATDLEGGSCAYESRQSITTRPVVRNNPIQSQVSTEPNKLVFFGTGQYLTFEDKSSTVDQSFYAVWDAGSSTSSLSKANLTAQEIENFADGAFRRINSSPVNYSTADEEYGWYYESLPGTGDTSVIDPSAERVVVDPIFFSDLLIFATFIPNEGLCNASAGISYLMVISPLTGGEPPIDVFGIDGAPDAAGVRVGGAITGIGVSKGSNGPSVNVDTADGEAPETYDISSSDGVVDPNDLFPASGRKSWTILQ